MNYSTKRSKLYYENDEKLCDKLNKIEYKQTENCFPDIIIKKYLNFALKFIQKLYLV